MSQESIFYDLPDQTGCVEFTPEALAVFEEYKQTEWLSKEAGGQLFAVFESSLIRIVEATPPRLTDKRSRCGFVPDRKAEIADIDERFERGLHFMGDWHTHPQKVPEPSWRDKQSMREMVSLSSFEVTGFLMVIVGKSELPTSLHVSLYTKTGGSTLKLTV